MTSSASNTSASPSSPDAEGPSRLRRWGRRVLWGLGGVVGTGLVLVGLLLLVLQTETGATTVVQFLAPRLNPMTHTTLSVEQASGSWVRSIRLTNVSLTRTDSTTGSAVSMAQVDTVAVQYRLGALLRGRIHLTAVSVSGPSVTVRQAADSTWDWARLAPQAGADTSEGMPIQIDRLRVGKGQFRAAFYAGGQDSTARIRDLELRAQALQLGPTYGGRLDTLGLQGHLPADTTALRLAAKGELSSRRLQLDTLQFSSPRSQVSGHGGAHLPLGPNDTLDDVNLSLRATPLVLGDLTAFLPTLAVDPREAINLQARLTGSGQRLTLTTNADVRNGGRLNAQITATPRTETAGRTDSLRYRIDAEARRLTTSLLGPPNAAQNRVTATLDGTLEGPTLNALDGTLSARVTDTRLYGVEAPTLALQSTVRDGQADVDLRGTVNGVFLTITGTSRPLDEAASADLTAEFRNLSLTEVVPDLGVGGQFAGTMQMRGRSIGTPAASYDVETTLTKAQVGRQPIDAGQVALAVRSDQLTLDARVRFPQGGLDLGATAALDGSERFTLNTGRIDNVNVAALAGDTTESRITAGIQAEGRGFAPETAQARGTISIEEAAYGPHRMSSSTLDLRLDAGRVTTETTAQLNGGTWSLAATARPFAAVPSVEVTRGRFRDVDIGPFLQDTTQSSVLEGTFQGRLQGTTPDRLEADAQLVLEPSRLNRQQIADASLDLTLRDGALQSTLALNTPDGGAELSMEGRPFEETPSYRVPEGSFERLDVGALAGISELTTALSGGFNLTAQGTAPATMRLESALTLRPSTINRASLADGRLTVRAEQGRFSTEGQFSVAGGALQLKGHLDSLGTSPHYDLRATARDLDVGALAGLDSLQASVQAARGTVQGRGTSLEGLSAAGRATADSVRVGQFRLRTLTVAGAADRGLLRVDTLSARSNVGTVQGEGPIGLTPTAGTSKFNVRATLTSAAPLRRLVGASALDLRKGVVDAHVYGPAGEQRFDGSFSVDGLIYDEIRLSDMSGTFSGARGTTQGLERLELEATAGYFATFGLTAAQTTITSVYDGTTVDLSTAIELDAQHNASLNASFRPAATPFEIQLRTFTARMGPDQWTLSKPTTLTVGSTYRIDPLIFESEAQRIEANGFVDPNGTQDLHLRAENVRLRGIAPLLGLSGLGGTVTGQADLTGPSTAPRFSGGLNLALRSQERDVGTLRLDVGYEALSVTLESTLTHRDGSVLTLGGTIPADLRLQAPTSATISDRPVQLDASTTQFPVNWIDPFLDPATVESVTGTLTADAEVRGTLADPDLDGMVSVANVGASFPSLGTRYRNGSAQLELNRDELQLTRSQLSSSNGGSVRVTGLINFPELTVGEYDLNVDASDFLAINTPAYRRAVVDGQMSLQGTVREPVLNGTVRVQSGSVFYDEALAESAGTLTTVELSRQDQLTLEERFGMRLTAADTTTFDMYEALQMDLTVAIERNTWLRSNGTPELNVQFTGDLDVQKAPSEDPRIFGTIDVVGERSTLRQFGQEFQITEGALTFNGDPYTPYMNLTAVYEQRARGAQGSEVRITLALAGRPENLTPTLSSEPSMSTRNILSYLATGRPADALFSGDSEGGNIATQVALGQASNFVENLAASELGLDIVRLQVRPEGTSYLTVGRYLTPEFFVSVEQPLLNSSSQTTVQSPAFIPDVTLEYQFTDYLLLRSRGSQQSLQLNLLFEYAY